MSAPTQRERIEAVLRRHGCFDATDFAAPDVVDGLKPVSRVAARIDEMRRQGWRIATRRLPNGTARYELVAEPGGGSPSLGPASEGGITRDYPGFRDDSAGGGTPALFDGPRCAPMSALTGLDR